MSVKRGTIRILFQELLALIESLDAFILDSNQKLARFDAQIAEVRTAFDQAVDTTILESMLAGTQAEVDQANESMPQRPFPAGSPLGSCAKKSVTVTASSPGLPRRRGLPGQWWKRCRLACCR